MHWWLSNKLNIKNEIKSLKTKQKEHVTRLLVHRMFIDGENTKKHNSFNLTQT